jgi:CMP-N-acetylneuraminic acid synthetase
MSDNETLAIVPARGGSKGIERKNIKELHGKPLITYTIDAANTSNHIDRVVVSTDDEEIGEVASSAGAEVPFMRPAKLARDETPTEPVVTHVLDTLDEDYQQFILLQPTSPLRTDRHIDEAIEKFQSTESKSLLSMFQEVLSGESTPVFILGRFRDPPPAHMFYILCISHFVSRDSTRLCTAR